MGTQGTPTCRERTRRPGTFGCDLGHGPLVPPAPPPPKHPHAGRNLGLLLLALVIAGLVGLLAAEGRTSQLQAREFSRYAAALNFEVVPGKSDRLRLPRHGPFDARLGYSRLGAFEDRLRKHGFTIARQARFSLSLMEYTALGFNPPYAEKTRSGLTLEECRGEPLYVSRHPRHHYPHFDAIPPRVLDLLLFIENRQLLDTSSPYANPAVDWPRLIRAALSQIRSALELPGQTSGGSTLATQIEKYRHSPSGLTGTPMEKLRQMVSASVRSYRDGPQTLAHRRQVALDYLNSVPLAAVPGHGEVHGLNDGLWAWFGADVDEVNRMLVSDFATPDTLPAQGLALRRVLALMIAQRRPSWYLGAEAGRDALEQRTDSYLRLLASENLIEPPLRDAALAQTLGFRDFDAAPIHHRVPSDPALQLARGRLAELLDVSHYELDRFDLEAHTTLHGALQQQVSDYLQGLGDPEVARAKGLIGERLLSAESTTAVRYAFTLFERGDDSLRVRVQTDTDGQPFDTNQDSKLELGSTAKLRVLASYLEIITELHQRHAGTATETLHRLEVDRQDTLKRWVVDRLIADPGVSLTALLDAAMARRYSASPTEAFFTGGGRHTFANFSREDDHRQPTLEQALQQSINLPFVRLLRDLVNHSIHRYDDRRRLLEDDQDPRRRDYLRAFADREGRVFLERFWRKYQGLDSDTRLATFLDDLPHSAPRLAAVYRYLYPEADLANFAAFLAERLPNETLADSRVEALYHDLTPGRFSLSDQGYLARVHPLELWLLGYLLDVPDATLDQAAAASRQERQEVYGWLFTTRYRGARDRRIRTLLEVEAFVDLHRRWQRLGYPFEHLVPSLATAMGASADRPTSLAELMGIILNDGVLLPTRRIDSLHFAVGTPYETRFEPQAHAVRVMAPEVAAVLREALAGLVEDGTARRLRGSFFMPDGEPLRVGGKTGTGDNRIETVSASGQVLDSRARNRTATFVFFLGEDHVGTLTAYVAGNASEAFHFTSSLPVQVLKSLEPILSPYLARRGDECSSPRRAEVLMAGVVARDP